MGESIKSLLGYVLSQPKRVVQTVSSLVFGLARGLATDLKEGAAQVWTVPGAGQESKRDTDNPVPRAAYYCHGCSGWDAGARFSPSCAGGAVAPLQQQLSFLSPHKHTD